MADKEKEAPKEVPFTPERGKKYQVVPGKKEGTFEVQLPAEDGIKVDTKVTFNKDDTLVVKGDGSAYLEMKAGTAVRVAIQAKDMGLKGPVIVARESTEKPDIIVKGADLIHAKVTEAKGGKAIVSSENAIKVDPSNETITVTVHKTTYGKVVPGLPAASTVKAEDVKIEMGAPGAVFTDEKGEKWADVNGKAKPEEIVKQFLEDRVALVGKIKEILQPNDKDKEFTKASDAWKVKWAALQKEKSGMSNSVPGGGGTVSKEVLEKEKALMEEGQELVKGYQPQIDEFNRQRDALGLSPGFTSRATEVQTIQIKTNEELEKGIVKPKKPKEPKKDPGDLSFNGGPNGVEEFAAVATRPIESLTAAEKIKFASDIADAVKGFNEATLAMKAQPTKVAKPGEEPPMPERPDRSYV